MVTQTSLVGITESTLKQEIMVVNFDSYQPIGNSADPFNRVEYLIIAGSGGGGGRGDNWYIWSRK